MNHPMAIAITGYHNGSIFFGSPTTGQARIIKDGDTKTKFADVAGCDGAKTELMEAENSKSRTAIMDEDKYDWLYKYIYIYYNYMINY